MGLTLHFNTTFTIYPGMCVPSIVLVLLRVAEILRGRQWGARMCPPAAGGWGGGPAAAELTWLLGALLEPRDTWIDSGKRKLHCALYVSVVTHFSVHIQITRTADSGGCLAGAAGLLLPLPVHWCSPQMLDGRWRSVALFHHQLVVTG